MLAAAFLPGVLASGSSLDLGLKHYIVIGNPTTHPTTETRLADPSETHAVRCCSDADIGWNKDAGCSVWGGSGAPYSPLPDPECGMLNLADADQACRAAHISARLCTRQELEACCTCGSGCNFDEEMTWSSTPGCRPDSP